MSRKLSSEQARAMRALRKTPVTTQQAQKAAKMRIVPSGGRKGGRPRGPGPRCGCGKMTLERARSRGKSRKYHEKGCEFYG